jgi:hypothetical protein
MILIPTLQGYTFLKSKCINLVKSQLEIRKILIVVLYKFVHEFNPKHISNMFNVGTSTIHIYVDIICDVLCNKNKLFGKYINIPFGDCLLHII